MTQGNSKAKWKLTPPPLPLVSAALSFPKHGKGSKKRSAIDVDIIEMTYAGLVAECPKDTVHQGEEVLLKITAYSEDRPPRPGLDDLEIRAKVARLTLGASQEGDILELQFLNWDEKRWNEIKGSRDALQTNVTRIFKALRN